jgi:hypothetical protein
MNGPGGQIRMWCNSCGTLGADWNSSIVAPFTVELNDQGHEAPEVSPWRLNLITNYTFDRGPIKGVFVGGALRMEASRILGYRYNPNFKNVNSTDPNYANVVAVTEGGLDVGQPIMGPTDTHVDMWVGYTRKVYKNVNWRVQLNLKERRREGPPDARSIRAGWQPGPRPHPAGHGLDARELVRLLRPVAPGRGNPPGAAQRFKSGGESRRTFLCPSRTIPLGQIVVSTVARVVLA